MRLLVIRHAAAGDKKTWARSGADDSLRPLTSQGIREMRAAARGLRVLVPGVDLLASSPFTRARQTADIVAEAYGIKRIRETKTLEPERSPKAVVRWLREHKRTGTVAIVGHEPHLGRLVTWLLTADADREAFIELDKGGACLLAFAKRLRANDAMLEWAMTREHLASQYR
jgi:phosphohistidine phosphatase